MRGSYARLRGVTGWEPAIPLEQTLADTVAWWTEEIRAGRAPSGCTIRALELAVYELGFP